MKKLIFLLFTIISMPTCICAEAIKDDESYSVLGLKYLSLIFILIIVVIIAHYGTKFLAKKSKKLVKSRHIKVIDSVSFGLNSKIMLVEMLNNIYILAVTNNNVSLIDKIDSKEFKLSHKDIKKDETKFSCYINKFLNKESLNSVEKNNVIKSIKNFLSFRKSDNNINKSKEENSNEENSNEENS